MRKGPITRLRHANCAFNKNVNTSPVRDNSEITDLTKSCRKPRDTELRTLRHEDLPQVLSLYRQGHMLLAGIAPTG